MNYLAVKTPAAVAVGAGESEHLGGLLEELVAVLALSGGRRRGRAVATEEQVLFFVYRALFRSALVRARLARRGSAPGVEVPAQGRRRHRPAVVAPAAHQRSAGRRREQLQHVHVLESGKPR